MVKEVEARRLSGSRLPRLEVLEENFDLPRLMTRLELIHFEVAPDKNKEKFNRYLKEGLPDDDDSVIELMEICFVDTIMGGMCHRNTIDHMAIQFSRGDSLLSISAFKLMQEEMLLGYDDSSIAIVLPNNACVAAIVSNFCGGDNTSNIFIDYRYDTPSVYPLQLSAGSPSCIEAIGISVFGEIIFRDWWKRLGIFNQDKRVIDAITDEEAFKRAQSVFELIPRNKEIASMTYPWFREGNWDAIPHHSI